MDYSKGYASHVFQQQLGVKAWRTNIGGQPWSLGSWNFGRGRMCITVPAAVRHLRVLTSNPILRQRLAVHPALRLHSRSSHILNLCQAR